MPRATCSKIGRRAFTLVELLVVIAILAVLAAILLPVLANAKASARAALIGNRFRQVALAAQMYLSDHDQRVMMHAYVRRGEQEDDIRDPLCAWPHQLSPYARTWSIFQDEGVPDPMHVWTDSRVAWWYNWQKWPALGLNVNYFNNAGGDCSLWARMEGMDSFGPPISLSQLASQSDTVMFVSTKRVGSGSNGFFSHTAEAPASITAQDTCTFTNGGWGRGSFGDSAREYPGNPTDTGDHAVSHLRGGVIVMADGSAKWMLPGALAAGTNWHRGVANHMLRVIDPDRYLWDDK